MAWWLCACVAIACQPRPVEKEHLNGNQAHRSQPETVPPWESAPETLPDTSPSGPSDAPAVDLLTAGAEHALPPDTVHAYTFHLRAGEALDLVVEQDGIDLALDLWDADGRKLTLVDGPGGPFGPELLARVADNDESLRLEVRPLKHHIPTGHYRLSRVAVQPATDSDRARAAAFEAHLIGDKHRDNRAVPAASAAYRRAADLWQRAAEPRLAARALRRLGQLQATQDFVVAQELFDRSRDLLEPLAKDWEWVGLHNDLGAAQRGVGDISAAEASYREAERVAQQRGDSVGLATAINNLGLVAQAAGREEDALRRYAQAEEIFIAADDRDRAMVTQANRSMVLASLGRYDDAASNLRQCLSYWQQEQEHHREQEQEQRLERQAKLLSSLGWLASLRGNDTAAIDHYDTSLGLREAAASPHREAVTYMLRGRSQASLGNPRQAQLDMQQALVLQQRTGDRLGEAYGRAFLGNLLLTEDADLEEAETHLSRATQLFEQMGDERGLAEIDFSRSRWHRRQGRLQTARRHLEAGIERLQSLRGRLLSPAFRRSVNASEHLDLTSYVDLLLDLHRAHPGAGHDRQAFEAAERFRGRGLSEELGLDPGWRLRADAELLQQQARSIEALQAAEMGRIEMARLRPEDPRLVKLQANIAAQMVDQARLAGEIRRSAGLSGNPSPVGPQLEELQRQLGDSKTTLLAFHIASKGEQSVAWVVRRDHFASHPIGLDDEALTQLANGAINALEQGDLTLFAQQARIDIAELSRRLLPPSLVDDLQGERLLVVPGGALALLPLALLDLPNGDKLGDHFDLAHLPSTSVWAALRRRRAGRTQRVEATTSQPPSQDLALIGAARYPNRPSQPASGRARRDAARQHFGPIPGSGREVEAILHLPFDSPPLALLGTHASRTTVLETRLDTFRILHFATHGLLEIGRPELSAIVLSLEDEQGRPIDGYLRVTDLERLRLDADLVVVSACRTGRGEWVRGEGVFGIGQALFKAGAQALVVSHWAVDDEATAELMPRFYRELLNGHSPAAALRRAQRELREETPWHDAVHWAAFSVQGDGLEPLF